MNKKIQRQYELGLKDTARFRYHNENPKGLITSDCSTRALALALAIPYKEALDKQCEAAKEMCFGLTDVEIVSAILTRNGFQKVVMKAVEKGHKRLKAGDAAMMLTEGKHAIIVMRLSGHFTVGVIGKVFDVWNCENKTVYQMWIKTF